MKLLLATLCLFGSIMYCGIGGEFILIGMYGGEEKLPFDISLIGWFFIVPGIVGIYYFVRNLK